MSSKADLTQANLNVELARKALKEFWDKALDEDGNFDWVFGDPSSTLFAVRIWVGYDEEDNVKVDIIYPASENAITDDNDGPTDNELGILEVLAYDNAHLLDKDVPSFAQIFYTQLQGLSPHSSLIDPLWDSWTEAKEIATQEAARYKIALKHQSEIDSRRKLENKKENKHLKVKTHQEQQAKRQQVNWLMAQAQLRAAHELRRKQAEASRKLKMEKQMEIERERARALAASDQRIASLGYKLFAGLAIPVDKDDEFIDYLKRVFVLESPFVLWSKASLSSLHPIIARLPWLQEVNLSENNLIGLPQELMNLPNLKRLFLHSNKIRTLPPLGGLLELEILDLHNNEITLLPTDLGLLTKLQVLDMEHNKLRVLPPEIGELDKLNHLNLARNRIKIVATSLVHLTNLTYMNLRLNPIVNLPPHIYVQGTAACLQYLREQTTDASQIQPSSMVADFSLLWAERKGFLADLMLRTAKDGPSATFLVHRVLVTSRCSVISNTLFNIQQRGIQLPTDSQTGLAILDLDLNQEQLTILVNYLYTDSYTKPELPLLSVGTHMTEEEIVAIVKQNQVLTMAYTAALTRASATATTFKLPHLQYLVDVNRKPTEVVPSSFIQDIKALYDSLIAPLSNLAALEIPVPSSSIETISAATPQVSSPAATTSATQLVPCDVSFSFPAHPDVAPIDAHKIILCTRSKFFSTLLTGGLIESKQRIVQINDIEPSVFKSIIEFCYTDDVYELSGETIMELLTAARLYALDRLLGIVESVVGYSLDTENVTSILTLSLLYSLARLGRTCKFFILSNWESVTRSPGWSELPESIRNKFFDTAAKWGIIQAPLEKLFATRS
jgi:hypothetical protein